MNFIYETDTFSKLYATLEVQEQQWIEKIKDQLQNTLRIGKPLHYYWFREKKFRNKRLFFLINESTHRALLIAFGNKKHQQAIIDHIILNKDHYFRLLS